MLDEGDRADTVEEEVENVRRKCKLIKLPERGVSSTS